MGIELGLDTDTDTDMSKNVHMPRTWMFAVQCLILGQRGPPVWPMPSLAGKLRVPMR